MMQSSLLSTAFRAALVAVAFSAARLTASDTPPGYPDRVHLTNGCQLSSMLFLRRYTAEFPAERGVRLVVNNYSGINQHSVSLVTWQGEWWCRDDRLGIFPLGVKVEGSEMPAKIEKTVSRELSRRAKAEYRDADLKRMARENYNPPAERRSVDVVNAASMVEGSTVYWVTAGNKEVPVLFFRPTADSIGVYDPAFGSAVAVVHCSNVDQIVTAVTKQLGYKVTSVHAAANVASMVTASVR